MESGWKIARIAGFDIRVHYSWLFIFALLTWSLAAGVFPGAFPGWAPLTYWGIAVLASLLLFGAVLLHEISHALVARARGLPVHSITLFIFGGVTETAGEAATPGVEFWMALVGPLTSLLLSGLCFGLAVLAAAAGASEPLFALLGYLAWVNLTLAVFNLIPGFPLDGGRVLRALLWALRRDRRWATRVAAWVGTLCGYLFILGGLWIVLATGAVISGLWLAFIGWFLQNAASAAAQEEQAQELFRGITVARVMNPRPVTIGPQSSLRELVDDYLLRHNVRVLPVVDSLGQLLGLITTSDLHRIPADRWSVTAVGAVMTPTTRLRTVRPDDDIQVAMAQLRAEDHNQLPVVEGERLAGLLTRSDILRYLQIRADLGSNREQPPSPPAATGSNSQQTSPTKA